MSSLADKLAPERTAVLIVDLQRDYVAPGGIMEKMGFRLEEIQDVVARIGRFADLVRGTARLVIFTTHRRRDELTSAAGREHYERRGMARPFDLSMEELYGIATASGDLHIHKPRYSAFMGTELGTMLRSADIKTLVLTGIATNVCVESTAREAFMRDYSVVIPRDLTMGTSPEATRASLENLDMFFGQVLDADDILDVWNLPHMAVPRAVGFSPTRARTAGTGP
jgi:ureidoacrylate peracid hydrolase